MGDMRQCFRAVVGRSCVVVIQPTLEKRLEEGGSRYRDKVRVVHKVW